jgi:hypothetical protein
MRGYGPLHPPPQGEMENAYRPVRKIQKTFLRIDTNRANGKCGQVQPSLKAGLSAWNRDTIAEVRA